MSRGERKVCRICEQCGEGFSSPASWVGRFCSKPCNYAWVKAQPRRQTAQSIRRLSDRESLPAGTPSRYKAANGYIVLRWKVGIRSYVEALEHRVVAGRAAPHVHHKNRKRDDNDKENLAPLTSLDHGAAHSRIDFNEASRLYHEGWSLSLLAVRYGVGNVTVLRFLKRRGVKMRTLSESWKFRKVS
jgi:hypothetical protein